MKVLRRADLERAPTTPGQRRDWQLLHELPDSSPLHLSAAFEIDGLVDADLLSRALGRLIHRHEALRTRFEFDRDRLTQVIGPPDRGVSPLQVDRRSLQEVASGVDGTWLDGFVNRPFDLEADGAFRVGLHVHAHESATLVLVLHHIVADQLSLGVVVRDLSALLESEFRGRKAKLHGLPVQFADYATWWDEKSRAGVFNKKLRYWARVLKDAPVNGWLPQRETTKVAVEEHQWAVPGIEIAQLHTRAAELQTTPYVVLLSAFTAALAARTGMADQVLGCGYANRVGSGLKHAVGRFSNNMALRIRSEPGQDGLDHVRTTHVSALNAYANASVSLDAVHESGLLPNAAEFLPDVAFQFVEPVDRQFSMPSARVTWVESAPGSVKQPLNVAASGQEGGLHLQSAFNPSAVSRAWIDGLLEEFGEQLTGRVRSGAILSQEVA